MYLTGLFVRCMSFTPLAIFLELNALWVELLVLLCRIVATLALFASERNECSHDYYLLLEPYPFAVSAGARHVKHAKPHRLHKVYVRLLPT